MEIVEFLRNKLEVLVNSTDGISNRLLLSSIWKIDMAFKPNDLEFGYVDSLIVAHSLGIGSSFCFSSSPDIGVGLIGQDIRSLNTLDLSIEIAALDSAFAFFAVPHALEFMLTGSIKIKSFGRASIVVNEVSRLVSSHKISNPKVLIVGSVGAIISELVYRNFEVFGTDLDPSVVGKEMSNVHIEEGSLQTIVRIAQVDVAIVTAMTLVTRTIDQVIEVAQMSNTRLVFFAQTGANLAPHLIELGIDVVVSEHFPFYMFPGHSQITVHRGDS